MAAATVYSSKYDSTGKPIAGLPLTTPFPMGFIEFSHTVATTSLDDAGDIVDLTPIGSNRLLVGLLLKAAALDGGTALDADIVLRTTDKNGVNTDQILYNAGTAFEAAQAFVYVPLNYRVPTDADDFGRLILYVNTAATTPAAGLVEGMLFWR